MVFGEKIRPDDGDRATSLCHGDLIMISCSVEKNSIAYLCAEGCVMKQDPHVEMRASCRELTFEVCSAHDTRALHEINHMLHKYSVPSSEKIGPTLSFRINFNNTYAVHFDRLLKKRETEGSANEAYAKVVYNGGHTPVKIFFRLRLQNLFPGVCPPSVAKGKWLAVVLCCAYLRVEAMVSIMLFMSKGGGHGFNVGALYLW
jgi:hypothetical protein